MLVTPSLSQQPESRETNQRLTPPRGIAKLPAAPTQFALQRENDSQGAVGSLHSIWQKVGEGAVKYFKREPESEGAWRAKKIQLTPTPTLLPPPQNPCDQVGNGNPVWGMMMCRILRFISEGLKMIVIISERKVASFFLSFVR